MNWKITKNETTPVKEFEATVESGSEPGTFYNVTYDSGYWYCTCKGFRFNGLCKHIKEAKQKTGFENEDS